MLEKVFFTYVETNPAYWREIPYINFLKPYDQNLQFSSTFTAIISRTTWALCFRNWRNQVACTRSRRTNKDNVFIKKCFTHPLMNIVVCKLVNCLYLFVPLLGAKRSSFGSIRVRAPLCRFKVNRDRDWQFTKENFSQDFYFSYIIQICAWTNQ